MMQRLTITAAAVGLLAVAPTAAMAGEKAAQSTLSASKLKLAALTGDFGRSKGWQGSRHGNKWGNSGDHRNDGDHRPPVGGNKSNGC